VRRFKEIKAWQKAHRVTLDIYKATAGFPSNEMYGLTTQMRRSAASVGANIAEGCGRKSKGELGRFMLIAMGSASELEYHLLLAKDLNFLSGEKHSQLEEDVVEVKKMLASYILQLKADG
jgi:four helix bundle protein